MDKLWFVIWLFFIEHVHNMVFVNIHVGLSSYK